MVMVPVVVEPKACLPKLRFFGTTSSVDPAAEASGELTKKKAANTTTKRLMLSPSQNDVLARHSLRGSSVRVALESSIRRDRKASWAPRPESTRLLPTRDKTLTRLQLGLLVLYGAEGWGSPYRVERLIRGRLGGVLGFGKSACYEQSKKLAAEGFLDAAVVERPRPFTLYRLTDRGRRQVERWLRTAAQSPPIDSEAFLRTRAASFVEPQVILQGLRHLRPDLTQRLAVDAVEAKLATRIPPLYLQLELDLIRSVLQTYLRWLNRTEKALTRDIRAGE